MKERTCECGQKFADLASFCDHQATHNATPAQWTDAYRSIQAAKDRAKKDKAE